MNRYQPSMPRAVFGLFALAMTAFTIALTVVAPANMDVSATHDRLVALSSAQHNGSAPRNVHEG